MKIIKTKTELKTLKGEVLKDGQGTVWYLGDTIANILAGKTNNPSLAWQLGKKFATEDSVELKAEDIVFLKKEIEAFPSYGAIVTGQIIEILEAKDTKEEK